MSVIMHKQGSFYNPVFESDQLLFLFLPLLKVDINQSLQLQKIFLHPFAMDILAVSSIEIIRCCFRCCDVVNFSIKNNLKGTYVKVDPLPLRDFRGRKLCDQWPIK